MGIAVRLWTQADLSKVMDGDRWLTTLLANAKTVNESMAIVLTQNRQKIQEYSVLWGNDEEETTIYATDDEMLLEFLKAEYTALPTYVAEVITTFRDVSLPQTASPTPV